VAKVRSPNYPSMPLGPALDAARISFTKDNRNRLSRAALGAHLGYSSLSGPALGKIAALRAYGIMEGSGDELRISDDAVTALNAPKDSAERISALERMALRPALFREINKNISTLPSEENLEFWLIKRQFTPAAAKIAAKSYLATMRVVGPSSKGYTPPADQEEEVLPPSPNAEVGDLVQVEINGTFQLQKPARVRAVKDHVGEKWVFIEGSETGIRMNQVRVEQKGGTDKSPPPTLPEVGHHATEEREWLRGPLSRETSYRLIVSGDLGPKEIGKLIKLLKVQQAVLSNEEDDESDEAAN
jgi:hypothetical protein